MKPAHLAFRFSPARARRRALSALGVAAAFSLAGLVAPACAADPIKLKFSSFEPPMANVTANVLTPFTKDVGAASKGALQIDMFAGGTLGRNPVQQLQLVQDAIADIAWIALAYTPGRFEDADVLGLPFTIRNATEASVAIHRLYANGSIGGFDGLHVLALASTNPVTIHGNRPVRVPEDLKGKRVRVVGDYLTRTIESIGGAPVSMAGGQVAESLSRGVVDLTLAGWDFVGAFKIDQVASHHSEVPLGASGVAVIMRKDRYDSLPPAARAALDTYSGEILARRIGEAIDKEEVAVRDRVAKSSRNTVIQPTAAELDAWKRVIEPLSISWRQAKPQNERTYKAFVEQLQRVREGK